MPAVSSTRRLVYLLASFALVWAVIASFTGGVGWTLGPLRISSRQPLRPLLIGLAAAAWYVWRSGRTERKVDGRWLEHQLKRAVPLAVPLIVVLGGVLGVHYGSFAAAGSDSSGYVSQARLWREGTLRVEQPIVRQVTWPNREWMFAPLGYRPVSTDGTLVPTYPAGLPIIMAMFLAIFGEAGPFYVVPVCAALALWSTYLLGREATRSVSVGFLAQLMLLASPVFLANLIVPTSDVPAAAGWALVALLALKGPDGSGLRPVLAGLSAGLTLLVRPNLVLLALVPPLAWGFRRAALVRYGLGLAPSLLALAALNTYLYGEPTTFGYGSVLESYSLGSVPQNLRSYPTWLIDTQTPVVFLALVPFLLKGSLGPPGDEWRHRACLLGVLSLTFLSYLFYGSFDHWFFLRFLLPAYPAMFVLIAAAVRTIYLRLPVAAAVPATVALCAAIIPNGVRVGSDAGIFNQAEYEQRHVRAAAQVAARTPPGAVIFSVQHSGSARYYANRTTLRYDALEDNNIDVVVRDLKALGHPSFAVLDDWEEDEFRTRFGSNSRVGRLNWAPLARVTGHPEVRIYDLEGRGE